MAESSSDGELVGAAAGVSLEKQWVVKTSGSKKTWVPTIKKEGDISFIRLDKFDRSFVYFCLGEAMDLGRGKSGNVQAFDELMSVRKTESIKAVEAVLFAGEQPGRTKKRKVREEDKELLSKPWVEIALPVFEHDGQTYGPLSAKAVWGVSDPRLWLEFRADILQYMRGLVREGHSAGRPGRTRARARPKAGDIAKKRSPKRSPKKRASPKKRVWRQEAPDSIAQQPE